MPAEMPALMRETQHGSATHARLLLVLATVVILPAATLAQNDNFNSGTDAGWTRYDPLAPFGYSTTYSFPNGGYRIAAPGTGDPAVGPGRAGSLREDRTYTGFQFSVDIVNWDTSHDQAIGLLARVTDPGLLTTDGYALTYSTVDRTIDLSRIDNEYLTRLASAPLPATPPNHCISCSWESAQIWLGKSSTTRT